MSGAKEALPLALRKAFGFPGKYAYFTLPQSAKAACSAAILAAVEKNSAGRMPALRYRKRQVQRRADQWSHIGAIGLLNVSWLAKIFAG